MLSTLLIVIDCLKYIRTQKTLDFVTITFTNRFAIFFGTIGAEVLIFTPTLKIITIYALSKTIII